MAALEPTMSRDAKRRRDWTVSCMLRNADFECRGCGFLEDASEVEL